MKERIKLTESEVRKLRQKMNQVLADVTKTIRRFLLTTIECADVMDKYAAIMKKVIEEQENASIPQIDKGTAHKWTLKKGLSR